MDRKGICEHNKHWSRCATCLGHNINKDKCSRCKKPYYGDTTILHNGKPLSTCEECRKENCPHGKRNKSECKECKKINMKNNFCEHNTRKERCIICTPDTKHFCTSCRLFVVKKSNNYLCSYCNPDKKTIQKTKEVRLKTFLENENYKFIYNKKCNLNNSCQTYFPDFLIDCNKFFLIIECDENAHDSYDFKCEKIRENNICYALGLPCVFIRYNPDKKGVKIKTKEKILKSYIEYYVKKEESDNETVYLFY